ncbi:MAG: CGGC domain-containing protein [Dehalococcoidia bacterium]|nr:CGGC domain-containing protein [Dehalococcoidia bacterium]MDD5493170.1 CGGC domain-containing protein [Dehalococcoidia bacterium]
MDKIIQKERKSSFKIGILTCSNITQDLGCASTRCLRALNTADSEFARYSGNVELVGIINCAGCPGIFGAEKLSNRIRTLTELNVDAIHFSSCLVDFCPNKDEYRKMINEKYPAIDVVFGTHSYPEGISEETHIRAVIDLIRQPKRSMIDLMKPFI